MGVYIGVSSVWKVPFKAARFRVLSVSSFGLSAWALAFSRFKVCEDFPSLRALGFGVSPPMTRRRHGVVPPPLNPAICEMKEFPPQGQ